MMFTREAESTLMPLRPVPRPLMSSPSIVTLPVAPALTTIEFVPLTSAPAVLPRARIVIDLVMVRPPKPPGSMTLISPAVAGFGVAPPHVFHGGGGGQGV